MRVFRSALSSVICMQIVLTSVLFSHPAMAERELPDAPVLIDDAIARAQEHDETRLKEIESAIGAVDLNQVPPASKDSFQVANQVLTYKNKKTGETRSYPAGEINVNLPTFKIFDFEREVKIGKTERGTLLFKYENKYWEVSHEMPSVRPQTVAQTKDMIGIVNTDGYVSNMDAGYTRENVFKSPLFTAPIAHSNLNAEELSQVEAAWISPGVNHMERGTDERYIFPPGPVEPWREKLPFGDFALFITKDGKRIQVGQFDHFAMQTTLAKVMGDLGLVVFQTSPPDNAKQILEEMNDTLGKDAEKVSNIDPNAATKLENEAFRAMSSPMLLKRAQFHRTERERGTMTRQEWKIISPELLEDAKSLTGNSQEEKDARAAAERGELGNTYQTVIANKQQESVKQYDDPRPLFRRLLTPRGMKIFATVTAVGAAGLVAANVIAPEQAWGMHLLNMTNAADLFPALKDAYYRKILILSSIPLLSFVPVTVLIGIMAGRKSGLPKIKALANITTKIYREVALPFWHRAVRLMRQPNFMKAMAQGVSPFRKVDADSPVGRRMGIDRDMRPGLSNPVSTGPARERVNNEKAALLNEMARQKMRVRALAWFLARQAVARVEVIDLPTFVALTSEEELAQARREELSKLAKTEAFQQLWVKTATETMYTLEELARGKYIEDIRDIDPKEYAEMENRATELARDIKKRDSTGSVLGRMKHRWNKFVASEHGFKEAVVNMRGRWENFASHARRVIANFGLKDYELLSQVPNDLVTKTFWHQFIVDYIPAVVQIGGIGDRADDIHHPFALAADPNGVAAVRAPHGFEMFDQVTQYMIAGPSQAMLGLQDPATVQENSFTPIERIAMAGKRRTTSLIQGYIKWAMGTFDPRRMDEFGAFGLRHFLGKMRTSQYAFATTVPGRVAIGGQAFTDALAACTWWELMRRWIYAWPWDLVIIGNKRYNQDAAANKKKLMDARSEIAEGVRLDDANAIQKGYEDLFGLHKDDPNAAQFNSQLNEMMSGFERLTDADLQALRRDVGPYMTAVSKLTKALYAGDSNGIAAARSELEAVYMDQGLAETSAARNQLKAIDFLNYSLANPPFETDGHRGVDWTSTTLIGAIPTTYLGTTAGVFTFGAVAWGPTLALALVKTAAAYTVYLHGTRFIAKASRYVEKEVKDNKGIRPALDANVEKLITASQVRMTRCQVAFKNAVKKASGE